MNETRRQNLLGIFFASCGVGVLVALAAPIPHEDSAWHAVLMIAGAWTIGAAAAAVFLYLFYGLVMMIAWTIIGRGELRRSRATTDGLKLLLAERDKTLEERGQELSELRKKVARVESVEYRDDPARRA